MQTSVQRDWRGVWLAMAVVGSWCVACTVSAQSFPQTVLLSQQKTAAPLVPAPRELRRSRVQWHVENLGDMALNVRHLIEPLPGLNLEVVFDGELFTYALSRSWHGHLSDDPGAQVTLTHVGDRLQMTIDSPKYGVIAVRDSRMNAVTNTIEAIASERDIFRVPFTRDDFGSYVGMETALRERRIREEQRLTKLQESAKRLTEEAEQSARDVQIAAAALEAAKRSRDEAGQPRTRPEVKPSPRDGSIELIDVADPAVAALELAYQRSLDHLRAAQERAQAAALNASGANEALLTETQHLQTARTAEVAMALIRAQMASRSSPSHSDGGSHGGTDVGSVLARQTSTNRRAAKLQGVSSSPSPSLLTASPTVQTVYMNFSPLCADSAGAIDVAAVVSSRVWDAEVALLSPSATPSTPAAIAVIESSITLKINHALDTANTALKRSIVSHAVFDRGFRLLGVKHNAAVLSDAAPSSTNAGELEPLDEWVRFNDTVNTAYNTALYNSAMSALSAPNNKIDVILSVIVGDGNLSTMRGVATIGDDGHQLARPNEPYAVVKMAALDAPEIHVMSHELGHILGAGHGETVAQAQAAGDPTLATNAVGFKSYARGFIDVVANRATLMGLSLCGASTGSSGSPSGFSCRRVPFFSNQDVLYPHYGGDLLGTPAEENVAIMRRMRNMVSRVACRAPAIPSTPTCPNASSANCASAWPVWLKAKPAALPLNIVSVNARIAPLPWEAQSLWRRAVAENQTEPRNVYQHQDVPPNESYVVTAFVHNTAKTQSGVLGLWRVKPPVSGGRWLSPRWDELERLNNSNGSGLGAGAPCAWKDLNLNGFNGVQLEANFAATLETQCGNVPFRASDDPLYVRWIPEGRAYVPTSTSLLVNTAKSDVSALWRSMTNVPLDVDQAATEIVVLRRPAFGTKKVQLSVKPAPGQGNFNAQSSGIDTVEIVGTVGPLTCTNVGSTPCVVSAANATLPSTTFAIKPNGALIDLTFGPAINALPPELPVKITFKRGPNDVVTYLPPTDVLIRVIESESGSNVVLGGASFVVQAKRK